MHRTASAATVIALSLALSLAGAGCASQEPSSDAPGASSQHRSDPLISHPEPAPLPEEEGGIEAIITATVDREKNPDARIASFELELAFERDEVLLYDLEARLPQPLSLDFDPGQFASGRIRLLGVNTSDDPRAGPGGSFEVARLSFAPAPPRTLSELRADLDNADITCQILTARAYGPLPEQEPLAVHFEVRFYFAVRRLE